MEYLLDGIIITNYMASVFTGQQTFQAQISREEIAQSISTIEEIMRKIGQTVNDVTIQFGEQRLFTEKDEGLSLNEYKAKLKRAKISAKKKHPDQDKLATVIEESTFSEQTSVHMITPRQNYRLEETCSVDEEDIRSRRSEEREMAKRYGIKAIKLYDQQKKKQNEKSPITDARISSIAQKKRINIIKGLQVKNISLFDHENKNQKTPNSVSKSKSKGKKGLSLTLKSMMNENNSQRSQTSEKKLSLFNKNRTQHTSEEKTKRKGLSLKKNTITPFLEVKKAQPLIMEQKNIDKILKVNAGKKLQKKYFGSYSTSKRLKL